MPASHRSTGPGRVNLIGDHTDYNDGLALPMAIDLGVSVNFTPAPGATLAVSSSMFPAPAHLSMGSTVGSWVASGMDGSAPPWSHLVAAVAEVVGLRQGGTVAIESDLPVGSGLSSSAALAVALTEVFGAGDTPEDVARLCQRAEHLVGVPVGPMDPLVCAGGRAGHALLIDCSDLAVREIALPEDLEVLVVDSGQRRDLRSSAYATRVDECRAAGAAIGPLGHARLSDLERLADPVLRRRARHVITECRRVERCADALASGDLAGAGVLMAESHRSLRSDFEVSTPELDRLVDLLGARPGVFGARMTGAGFGGSVVALCRPGALDPAAVGHPAWQVEAADGTVTARRRRSPHP